MIEIITGLLAFYRANGLEPTIIEIDHSVEYLLIREVDKKISYSNQPNFSEITTVHNMHFEGVIIKVIRRGRSDIRNFTPIEIVCKRLY